MNEIIHTSRAAIRAIVKTMSLCVGALAFMTASAQASEVINGTGPSENEAYEAAVRLASAFCRYEERPRTIVIHSSCTWDYDRTPGPEAVTCKIRYRCAEPLE